MKKRPEEGDIYREINIFDTYGSKKLNCETNFHTLAGGSVIVIIRFRYLNLFDWPIKHL